MAGKKTNPVTVFLDDRDFHDLQEVSDENDRTPADMLRHLFRCFMRHRIGERLAARQQDNEPLTASEPPSNVSPFTARERASGPIAWANPWRDTEQQG